ncbi:DUF2612 domain-containing protein [Lysinibacillus capsici]|uniref:DUF2612 domain-containing protein n=1 Tax=Lysinibacillus capsici TaxID=2115968 RepID=UPI0032E4EBF4
MFSTKAIVGRFVDYFNKRPESNISKLISIYSEELQEAKEASYLIRSWRSIDNAEGTTLDRIGEDIKQLRGSANDERYRVLLKAKIARNLSDGTTGTIIRILSLVLSTPPSDIEIIEKWNDVSERERAAIRINNIPASRLYEAGMTPDDFLAIVQAIVAAGVKVRVIQLIGTFEFGGETIMTSEFKGMADEQQKIGGTLGLIMDLDDKETV